MKITFLGTGSLASFTSANTSILIDNNILVDIGTGTLTQLKKYNKKIEDIRYILISHYHSDHFLDIANLILSRADRNQIDNNLIIIGPTKVKEKIIELLRFTNADNDTMKFRDIAEKYNIKFVDLFNDTYSDETIEVKSMSMVHGQSSSCIGFVITKNNAKVGYSGDTTMCANLHEMCSLVNNMIIDANDIETTMAHLGLTDVMRLSEQYPNCNFYAIHRSDYQFKDESDKVKFPKDGEEIEMS